MKDIREIIEEKIIDTLKKLDYYDSSIAIKLEQPKQEEHGDWSTSVALQLASLKKKNPRQIAQDIINSINIDSNSIEKVEIAGPGFLNFYLGWGYYRNAVLEIIENEENFGKHNFGNSKKIQVEFVSANPTGPLNVVSARAASVGDIMVNLFNEIGFNADKEFYINDAGRQIRLLGTSVSSRYMNLFGLEEEFPEEGYHGEYIKDLAVDIKNQYDDKFISLDKEERINELSQIALNRMVKLQKEIMDEFRVNYDTWFHESLLRNSDEHLNVLRLLKQSGYTYEDEGATWFKSSEFGDEKDRVLVTSEGEPTYFLVDIAYHQNKYQRGYTKIYDIWGPDHHGYIARMQAAIQALGYPKDSFQVEIVQQVNLLRSGEVIKMSKRAGQIIEMKEVIDEVGIDTSRFFFVNRKCNSHLDFDIDLAKKQSDENPVYYVQYAYARICNIIRFAEEQGIILDEKADPSHLKENEEKQLIQKLLNYPDIVLNAAKFFEPHRLTVYLQELAATFHHFYHYHRVVSEDNDLSKARLLLVNASKIVFANGFKILGISAPEKM